MVELEKLLKKVLEGEKYINLQFDKAQTDNFTVVPLSYLAFNLLNTRQWQQSCGG